MVLRGMGFFSSFSLKLGYFTAAKQRGITLLGPILTHFLNHTWLSPPFAELSILMAFTRVCHPPTTAPFSKSSGTPFFIMETSVLVPPTSITAQVSSPER